MNVLLGLEPPSDDTQNLLPYVVISCVVALAGLFGNIIIILMTFHTNLSKYSYAIYLRVIAIFDSLVLLVATADNIMEITDTYMDLLNSSVHLNRFWEILTLTSSVASPFLLVALSLDRCIAIAMPFHKTKFCSKKIATIVCTCVVLAIFIFSTTFGTIRKALTTTVAINRSLLAQHNHLGLSKESSTSPTMESLWKRKLLGNSSFALDLDSTDIVAGDVPAILDTNASPWKPEVLGNSNFRGVETNTSFAKDLGTTDNIARDALAFPGNASNIGHLVEPENFDLQTELDYLNWWMENSRNNVDIFGEIVLSDIEDIYYDIFPNYTPPRFTSDEQKDYPGVSMVDQTYYLRFVLHAILPCLLLAVLNSIVVVKIRQSLAFRKKSVVRDGNSSILRSSIPLIAVTVLAFVALCPIAIIEIFEMLRIEILFEDKKTDMAWHVGNVLYLLNFSQNFYILIASSGMYRKTAKDVLPCYFRCRMPRTKPEQQGEGK